MIVHKFGGTSLASPLSIKQAISNLCSHRSNKTVAVVSASAKITDRLAKSLSLATLGSSECFDELQGIIIFHKELAQSLILEEGLRSSFIHFLESRAEELKPILEGTHAARSYSNESYSLIMGFGEELSSQLIHILLLQNGYKSLRVNARDILSVKEGEMGILVNWDQTKENLNSYFERNHVREVDFYVITGYLASTEDKKPTTLGRNGSDFSASIFASLLDSEALYIWTDVDGVMSADPRKVPHSFVIDDLSYSEAVELAYFGAKVLHPNTMSPVIRKGIPIYIRNTFNPDCTGTRISSSSSRSQKFPVKGFSSIENIALLNVEGNGMIGVPGVAERLFRILGNNEISVILISQGSSEHSICFAIPDSQSDKAKQVIEREFYYELNHGLINQIHVFSECTILAAVGDGMMYRPGTASRFFNSLSQARVNIRAIAQGSNERNISAVIDNKDSNRALRAVHSGFYLSAKPLSVGIIGPGLIGKTFLKIIKENKANIEKSYNLSLSIRGTMNSKRMRLEDEGISESNLTSELTQENSLNANMEKFTQFINSTDYPHSVIIDCTASGEVAEYYQKWFSNGIHVITPNKKANTLSMEFYKNLHNTKRANKSQYLYETTVGAGLPVIQTLRDLIDTGDEIHSIEGIFSGTLSFLFNSFDGSIPFSQIVSQARDNGFTEPDPRDDLDGSDVGRKVLILAREMGLELELNEVEIMNLVPEELLSIKSIPEFMNSLPKLDESMNKKIEEAKVKNQVLRYVGKVDPKGKCTAKLESYPVSHPFAGVQLTDNIIAFKTRRYFDQPLIVQGPGAGPAVTAGGVVADLLRLATRIGATTHE